MFWKISLKVVLVIGLFGFSAAQPEVNRICRPYNNNHCYTMYGNRTTDFTWYQADAFCKSMDEHLVSIPDKETEDLLVMMLRGADEMLASGYAWTSGQTSNDTRWRNIDGDIYTGYVSAARDTEACGSLSQRLLPGGGVDIVLTGQACNGGRHPLCQVPREDFCLYNEIPIPPYCYRLLDHSASWFDAEIKCEEYAPGAHLAYTHISEQSFIDAIMQDQAISIGETTWVGIYMRPWFWRLNECALNRRTMLYSNWDYVSHPPLSGVPEALAIGKNGRWRDYLVTTKHDYFICEKDDGLQDGHNFNTNCPPPQEEELPTIPLEFPPTTPDPVTDTMEEEEEEDDNTKDLSTAALVVAVVSACIVLICVIAVCISITQMKRALKENARPEKSRSNRASQLDQTRPQGQPNPAYQMNAGNTNSFPGSNVWYNLNGNR